MNLIAMTVDRGTACATVMKLMEPVSKLSQLTHLYTLRKTGLYNRTTAIPSWQLSLKEDKNEEPQANPLYNETGITSR